MTSHAVKQRVEAADQAINREDFDSLMDFYADDATLVVKPGMNVTGKAQIRQAFVAIAGYFNHSLVVKQGDMQIIEGANTALVLARTQLSAKQADGTPFAAERLATYVFSLDVGGVWRCTVDNSYGTELLSITQA
ncbi:YybH family protein [Chitinimonas naiadis]